MTEIMKNVLYLTLIKFYYQKIARQIFLIHKYIRLLQHVLAVSYSHLQGTLIYRGYMWNLTSSAVNGKIRSNYVDTYIYGMYLNLLLEYNL